MRSTARAGRRPAFQAVGATSAFGLHAEVGTTLCAWSGAVRGAEHRACRSETGVPGRRFRLSLNQRRGVFREAAEVAVREEQEDGSFVSAGKLAHPLHNGGMIVQHVRRDAR